MHDNLRITLADLRDCVIDASNEESVFDFICTLELNVAAKLNLEDITLREIDMFESLKVMTSEAQVKQLNAFCCELVFNDKTMTHINKVNDNRFIVTLYEKCFYMKEVLYKVNDITENSTLKNACESAKLMCSNLHAKLNYQQEKA